MYRGTYSPNPHGQAPPYTPGDGQFRSPRPRFHQQSIPHHSGPGGPGPSPHRTPPHLYRGPSPRGPYPRPFTPGNHSVYSPRTPSPYHNGGAGGRGRGYSPRHSSPYTPGTATGGSGRANFNSGRKDCNPGGIDDITCYYKPNMMSDPWQHIEPVSKASQSS